MNPRLMLFLLVLCPLTAFAQAPITTNTDSSATAQEWNGPTRAVLLANKPERFTEGEWLRMMEKSVNRSLYPLRVTREMLDTLDTKALDLRFRYEMTP
ncbi:MAG TPA: hypothetical protein PLN54_02160 [Flavobacteriales bacterium]|nr:hypothetical protein [Flavobacteriales bacterium]